MNEKPVNKCECIGCGLCEAICVKKCIQMKADDTGFYYPVVNEKECIDCGKCIRQCPCNKKRKFEENYAKKAYAVQAKNLNIRKQSSSGGVFYLLAKYFIEKGGIVVGASFDSDFRVRHICIDKIVDINKVSGTKYVQSDVRNIWKKVKAYLEEKRLVLFTGTPCQIGALKAYLGKDYENLYTQDVVCHGVPSPMVWEKYLKYLEKKQKSKVENVLFRCKEPTWSRYSLKILFKNGSIYLKDHGIDLYFQAYLKNLSTRLSCEKCKFKGGYCEADITLGDLWGIKRICPDFDDEKGTSLVLLHTDNGKNMFQAIRSELKYKDIILEDAIQSNPSIIKNITINPEQNRFLKDIKKRNIAKVIKKYCGLNVSSRVIRKLKIILHYK